MYNIHSHAREMAARRNQPMQAWHIALERADSLRRRGMISPDHLERLTDASMAPSQVLLFCDYVARGAHAGSLSFEVLAEHVDETRYSLKEWLKAMESFNTWILGQKRTTSYEQMLGYISCCAEMGSQQTCPPDLDNLVTSMLKQYGFEGQTTT